MNALVIDDSRAMRTIIRVMLTGIGFRVREAQDGAQGLQRLGESPTPIELMMVDWNMPVMDGLEFVRRARARGERDSRIVMVTTENEVSRMAEALNEGADEYIMKPFTLDILVSKLESLKLIVA